MNTNLVNFTLANDNTSNDFPKLNTIFGNLIANDLENTFGNRNAPGIWEQTWMTADEDGYMAGQAVWLNTDTIENLVNNNMNKISSYVTNQPDLLRKFMTIDRSNPSEIVKFFRRVANGTVSPNVSALYYPGDIRDHIQIMVSRVDNNKTYPVEGDYWRPIISINTSADQLVAMYEILDQINEQRLSSHFQEYHLDRIPSGLMGNLISKHPETNLQDVKKYYFISHQNTQHLTGFDYVVDFKYDNGNECWYRRWNSGYLEQGGFIENMGDRVLRIQFLKNYNYPAGARFYQEGYTSYTGADGGIGGHISPTRRYMVTVTPVMGRAAGNISPYEMDPQDPTSTGTYSYVNVDAFKFDNDGFCIVNLDTDQQSIVKYSWYTSGFIMTYNETEANTLMRQSYHVDFYDDKGGVVS